MSTAQLVLSVILIVVSLFLVATVLLQSGASQGISGTIAGGAETFFGSGKAKGMDAMLARLTTVAAVVFVVLVVALNMLSVL
jgi:preprotein translocase subunit SecG